jgi:hypothetical protein
MVRAEESKSAPDLSPALFTRLSRSVVKVRSGDDWQTGFVFGTSRNVVTSYFVANESGNLTVVGADHKAREARVVAWSEEDDLALLEVDDAIPAPPLEASHAVPWTPEPIAVLYQPQEADPDSRVAESWNVPIALIGHVARVFAKEIDIEANLYGRPGDFGAPVVNRAGQVLGIVSHATVKRRRTIVTRVERAESLLANPSRGEEFSRSISTAAFGALFVSPLETKGLVGAGVDFGMRYGWFALEMAEGVYQSGYRPLDSDHFERTQRFQFEMAAEIELPMARSWKLFIGPAARFNFDLIESLSALPSGALDKNDRGDVHVRPAVVLGLVSGSFFVRGSYGAESRVDFGLIIGR